MSQVTTVKLAPVVPPNRILTSTPNVRQALFTSSRIESLYIAVHRFLRKLQHHPLCAVGKQAGDQTFINGLWVGNSLQAHKLRVLSMVRIQDPRTPSADRWHSGVRFVRWTPNPAVPKSGIIGNRIHVQTFRPIVCSALIGGEQAASIACNSPGGRSATQQSTALRFSLSSVFGIVSYTGCVALDDFHHPPTRNRSRLPPPQEPIPDTN